MSYTDSPPWLVGVGGGGGSGEIQPQVWGSRQALAGFLLPGWDTLGTTWAHYYVSEDFVSARIYARRDAGAGNWTGLEFIMDGIPLEFAPANYNVGDFFTVDALLLDFSTDVVSSQFCQLVIGEGDTSGTVAIGLNVGAGSIADNYYVDKCLMYPRFKAA